MKIVEELIRVLKIKRKRDLNGNSFYSTTEGKQYREEDLRQVIERIVSKRVLLDEKDFTELISGKIVKQNGVEIALQDIGYNLMLKIIQEKI